MRAWTETVKGSHKGKFYEFKDVEIRPRPAQKPLRPYVAASRAVDGACRQNDWNVIYAPFAAAMVYGSLADAVRVYKTPARPPTSGRCVRAMCSYFVHIASTPAESITAMKRWCATSGRADRRLSVVVRREGAAELQVLRRHRDSLRDMRPEKLTDKSILAAARSTSSTR